MSGRQVNNRARAGVGALGRAARAMLRSVDATLWFFIRTIRAMVIGVVALGGCVGATVLVATWEVSLDLPAEATNLMDGREKGSVSVLDRNGELLGTRGQRFNRLTIAEAGPVLVDAILATEDRRFYWHIGIDPIGLTRAILVNMREGRTAQGGSSITQQVAKLAFLSNERTFGRKLRELPLSLALEWRYSKDEILEVYLNRAYLGAGAFGFKAAAKFYFEKLPKDLTYAEAALLAGLLRAPSRWSPTNDFTAAQNRARVILDAMMDAERISALDHKAANDQISFLRPPTITESSPYFVDWVAEQIPDSFWDRAPDLVVTTTLDRKAQSAAESAISRVFAHSVRGEEKERAEAAVVVLSHDGAVRAMVGGRDYASSQFNRATSSGRQLGSAFKPIVFAAAMQTGLTINSKVKDAPITIGNWSPKNYANTYRGWVSMTTALARSSNVAAVRLSQRAGVSNVVQMARRFGLAGYVPKFPSVALGAVGTNALEVAAAYAVFANDGAATPAYGVMEIRNRRGDVLWSRTAPQRRQVISVEQAEWMRSMMGAVVEWGTARRAQLSPEVLAYGKTGTTQSYRDAWFAGFTDDYVAVSWLGRDDDTDMRRVTGGSYPAEIWRESLAPLYSLEPRWGVDGGPRSVIRTGPSRRRQGGSAATTRADRTASIERRRRAVERVRRRQPQRTRRVIQPRRRTEGVITRRRIVKPPRTARRVRRDGSIVRRRRSSPRAWERGDR